jgi:hypothetical protein
MINLDDNEILLRCSCDSTNHVALLREDDDGIWFLSVLLDPVQPWYRRVWRALWSSRDCPYAELVLSDTDVRGLAEFIRGRLGDRSPTLPDELVEVAQRVLGRRFSDMPIV